MSKLQATRERSPARRWLPLAVAGLLSAEAVINTVMGQAPRNLPQDRQRFVILHQTEHYRLGGTVSQERIEEFGRALEFIHREYSRGFGELLSRKPAASAGGKPETRDEEEVKFLVMILKDRSHYDEFTAAYFGGFAEHTNGLFVPSQEMLVIRDEPGAADTYQILFHEAFHQFAHRHVPHLPMWANEGLATYFGTGRLTPGGLVFNDTIGGYYRIAGDALHARELIPLDQLMLADRPTFYSRDGVPGQWFDKRNLHYAQAYTLVRLLMEDAEGRKHLREYLRLLAGAKSDEEAARITREHYPPGLLQRLSTSWIESVRRG